MPAYERPIQIFTDDFRPAQNRQVAAVVKFSSDDMGRIQEYLGKLQAAGIITGFEVKAYDAAVQSPVLYFP